VKEPGSQAVRALLERAQVVSTSRVAYVEMRAGLARKLRQGELSEEEYGHVLSDFEKDWKDYFVIEFSESVAKMGGELVEKHPLRALDALHLASALFLRERARSDVFSPLLTEGLTRRLKRKDWQCPALDKTLCKTVISARLC